MSLLIISDIHLGKRFDKNKFNYLKNLVSKYDEIILNGDFWDYYSVSFDDFVNSEWNKLFPVMEDKTIYIYGNHDQEKWVDSRVKLFSKKQTNKHELIIKDKRYIFIHGHTIGHTGLPHNIFFIKIFRISRLNILALMLDYLIAVVSKNEYKDIETFAGNLEENEILVTGHKHIPTINLDKKYAVSGCVLFGKSSYLEIGERGDIKIIDEKY